ncbi:ribose 5-phosphate isomerase B [bacterium]|nr:ribose 5-phosphate isomerase B [bacterium]
MKKIIIGSDHAGFELKTKIINFLETKNYNVTDVGCYSSDSVDYPDFAHKVADSINKSEFKKGILICGSGNGVSITANKYALVRAALSWNIEIAKLARLHNDANIVCIPARFISVSEAIEIVEIFLETDFEGGRHLTRVKKIPINNKD